MWAWAIGNVITAVHPGSDEQSVRQAAAVRGETVVDVPDSTPVGARLDTHTGLWVVPPPPSLPPGPPPQRWINAYHFRLRFTEFEEAAITEVAKVNPVVRVMFERLTSSHLENVDLNLPSLAAGLTLLSSIDNPLSTSTPRAKLLTPARIAELLA